MLWQGAIVNIPDGWVLCDGNNDTPDLRNQMVPGANGIYAQDETGGIPLHDHDFTGDGHLHTIPVGTGLAPKSGAVTTTDPSQASGTSVDAPNLPSYYALAFIMFKGE